MDNCESGLVGGSTGRMEVVVVVLMVLVVAVI